MVYSPPWPRLGAAHQRVLHVEVQTKLLGVYRGLRFERGRLDSIGSQFIMLTKGLQPNETRALPSQPKLTYDCRPKGAWLCRALVVVRSPPFATPNEERQDSL